MGSTPQIGVSPGAECAVKVGKTTALFMDTRTITPVASDSSACLVEIIELKWLLAAHGVHVHVEQLQHDREYARRTLDRADRVPNKALREAAARLRICLGLTLL